MKKNIAKLLRNLADRLDPQHRIVIQPGSSYTLTMHGGGGGGGSGRPGSPGGSATIEGSPPASQQIPGIHSQQAEATGQKRDQDDSGNKRD